jgi:hypothetical protein
MDEHIAHVRRGGFARDKRTGAVVKVAEKGGRDWMVRPAYKSDGYWTGPENLTPVPDPHALVGWTLVRFFVVLAVAGAFAFRAYSDMTHQGLDTGSALGYTFPFGAFTMVLFNYLLRVSRP